MTVTDRVNNLIMFKVKKAIKECNNFSVVDDSYVFSTSDDDETVALLCDVKLPPDSDTHTSLYLLHKHEDSYVVMDLISKLECEIQVSDINTILLSRSNTRVIIGLPQKDCIYIYDVNNFYGKLILRGILKGKDTIDGDMFGYSIAANHDASIVVVGSPYSTIDGRKECGAVHVFKLNEQGQEYREIGRTASIVDGRGKKHDRKYYGIEINGGEEIMGGGGVYSIGDGNFCTHFYVNDRQWGSSNLGLDRNACIVSVYDDFEQLKYI